MALPEAQRQENFSLAYVRAIAAACGFSVQEIDDDYDSVDVTISAVGTVQWLGNTSEGRSPMLALQLKCTYAHAPKANTMTFPLPLKNYDDLRDSTRCVPAILVVLYTPKPWPQRLQWSDEHLILERVAYWTSLRGRPQTDNTRAINVTLSETFSPEVLTHLMFMVAQGEVLA